MVGKMPNVTWLDGSFAETMKGWQSGWFYITEPRDSNWVAAPKFRSGIPTWLTSWKEKGLSWGSSVELTGLQTCIKNMMSKKIKLTNVIQVMSSAGSSRVNDGHSICGSSTRSSTKRCENSSTRHTRTSRRCCSKAPRCLLPAPRTAD